MSNPALVLVQHFPPRLLVDHHVRVGGEEKPGLFTTSANVRNPAQPKHAGEHVVVSVGHFRRGIRRAGEESLERREHAIGRELRRPGGVEGQQFLAVESRVGPADAARW